VWLSVNVLLGLSVKRHDATAVTIIQLRRPRPVVAWLREGSALVKRAPAPIDGLAGPGVHQRGDIIDRYRRVVIREVAVRILDARPDVLDARRRQSAGWDGCAERRGRRGITERV